MSDTYQPSNLGTPGTSLPSRPVTPTPPTYQPSPLPDYSANLKPLSQAVEHHESGGKNVTSPAGAMGPRQIMPATFKQFALPGESITNPADNRAVGDRILNHYLQIYHGDAARAAVAYFSGPGNVAPPGSPTPWIHNTGDGNNTVAQYVAATAGKMGSYGGTSTPVASGAAQPSAAPMDVGMALAALNQPGSSGQSTMQNLQNMLGQQQPDNSRAPDPGQGMQLQQAAGMGNARQQQIAAQAAQMAAALRQQAGQPLTWTSAPYGSTAGSQRTPTTMTSAGGQIIPTPGTTLTSMGYSYV